MRRLGALAIFTLTALCAQSKEAPPVPGPGASGNEFHLVRVTLADLISLAYQLAPTQIHGPSWLGHASLDLVAEVPPGMTRDQAPHILQLYLAQQFKLAVHHETRMMHVFLLEVAPGGPKLDETPAYVNPAAVKPVEFRPGVPGGITPSDLRSGPCMLRPRRREVCQAASMPELARWLQRRWRGVPPVLDRTGLKGTYDFTLNADYTQPPYNFSSMIQYQLKPVGLTVKKVKEAVDILVIDHCEKRPLSNLTRE